MTFPIFFVIKSMKYEVTGDTIVIKYIADGKYKQLELNKNDNIDLDFFGQLIKAKNNKQDAMCDLYAKEVLSYDPSPERITNMNLTKLDEPSEYTKKEDAKLRIEELKRDLESTEKDIKSIIMKKYEHKKIEDLIADYVYPRTQSNLDRYNYLKNKYITIKDLIDKQQKIYDSNTKKENLTQDELIRTLTDKIETKISNVVENSGERRQIVEEVKNELTPKDQINIEIENLAETKEELIKLLDTKFEEEKPKYIEKQKQIIAAEKEKRDFLGEDDEKKDVVPNDEEMLIDAEPKLNNEDENEIKHELLSNDKEIKEQIELLNDHIKIFISLLEKTDIESSILESLKQISKNINEINVENLGDILDKIDEVLNTIYELNSNNKIMYTQQTFNKVFSNVNKILLENERIKTFYNKNITPEFFNTFMSRIYIMTDKTTNFIKGTKNIKFTKESLNKIFNEAPITLIWKKKKDSQNIYSNKKLFGIAGPTTITFKELELNCFVIRKNTLINENFSLFSEYISTNKSGLQLPLKSIELYLDIRSTNSSKNFTINTEEHTITYEGFDFYKSNVSNILQIVTGFGEGIKNKMNIDAGKIDLDKADTEDKLSEIVRLLQNISYNLFTLTPNYEESEKNKRLKSKGIDLKEMFDGFE